MLTVSVDCHVDRLVELARNYIIVYAYNKNFDECHIPFRQENKKRYVKFVRVADNWVFIEVFG